MRKTKIVGFSIPPALHKKFEAVVRKKHKTKSEFFREILESYFKTSTSSPSQRRKNDPEEIGLAKTLKTYWELRSSGNLKTIIIGLGIVARNGRVLIGARKDKDPWVENLTWVFPGGKMNSLDIEEEIKKQVKNETNLKVSVENLITARIHPDSGFKPIQIVALYFHCKPISTYKAKPGGDLSQLKWVKPTEVFKYFTTSTCDQITKFLLVLEKAS